MATSPLTRASERRLSANHRPWTNGFPPIITKSQLHLRGSNRPSAQGENRLLARHIFCEVLANHPGSSVRFWVTVGFFLGKTFLPPVITCITPASKRSLWWRVRCDAVVFRSLCGETWFRPYDAQPADRSLKLVDPKWLQWFSRKPFASSADRLREAAE